MKTAHSYLPGIEILLAQHKKWLKDRRVGLVAHPASVDADGIHSAIRLRETIGPQLTALFGAEHGFFGRATAGERVDDGRHTEWNIPVHSLYGATRRPSPEMLQEVDTIIFDLFNLPIRCYTYASTLRYLLEAAAEYGKSVIVTDRWVPLADTLDGPMLDPTLESFVGMVNTPLCYGMTTGELARFICREYNLPTDLRVAPFRGPLTPTRPVGCPWIPPSPGIRTVHTAESYPITVCCEALPVIDYAKGLPEVFQLMGCEHFDANMIASLNELNLPGLTIRASSFLTNGHELPALAFDVTDISRYQPICAMYAILSALQQRVGKQVLWETEGSRPAFFDKLMGTSSVRTELQQETPLHTMSSSWNHARTPFIQRRKEVLLYSRETTAI